MSAYGFRTRNFNFDSAQVRQWLGARRPRNLLLRVALGLVGLAVLLVLLVLGAVIGTLMVLGGLALRLLRTRGKPQASGRVLDGDYRVVGKSLLPRGH